MQDDKKKLLDEFSGLPLTHTQRGRLGGRPKVTHARVTYDYKVREWKEGDAVIPMVEIVQDKAPWKAMILPGSVRKIVRFKNDDRVILDNEREIERLELVRIVRYDK